VCDFLFLYPPNSLSGPLFRKPYKRILEASFLLCLLVRRASSIENYVDAINWFCVEGLKHDDGIRHKSFFKYFPARLKFWGGFSFIGFRLPELPPQIESKPIKCCLMPLFNASIDVVQYPIEILENFRVNAGKALNFPA